MFGLLVDILRSAYKTSYGAGGLFEGEYGYATGYKYQVEQYYYTKSIPPSIPQTRPHRPFENDDPLDMRARGAIDRLEATGPML
jgi:hypothetical protein